MSLTFSGTPLYVRIRAGSGNGDFFPTIPSGVSNYYFPNKTDYYGLNVTLEGNTMTWWSGYTNATATYAELNVNATKYRYMALVI